MHYTFKNLPPRNPERVGYGPQMVGGGYGPQLVGQGMNQIAPSVLQRALMPGARYVNREAPAVRPGGSVHPLRGGGHLINEPPTSKQVVFLGFGPQTLAGGATFVFEGKPQRIFRGERLTVPSTIANNFSINDLKVGTDSMNVGTGPIPAAIFSELGMLVALEIETASPGIEILFSITNNAAGNQQMFAGLLGTSVTS